LNEQRQKNFKNYMIRKLLLPKYLYNALESIRSNVAIKTILNNKHILKLNFKNAV